jgi:hypothetical protein
MKSDRMTLQDKLEVDKMMALNNDVRVQFASIVAAMNETPTDQAVRDLQSYTSKIIKHAKVVPVRIVPRIHSSPDDL